MTRSISSLPRVTALALAAFVATTTLATSAMAGGKRYYNDTTTRTTQTTTTTTTYTAKKDGTGFTRHFTYNGDQPQREFRAKPYASYGAPSMTKPTGPNSGQSNTTPRAYWW